MILLKDELLKKEYGISDSDLNLFQKKFEKNVKFLSNSYFVGKSGQKKIFLDVSIACNYSHRYHCELNNRMEVLNIFNIEKHYTPIFITATLDSQYRDFLYGNYNRIKDSDLKSMPKDIKSKMRFNETLDIKDLKNILNYKIKLFQNFYNRKYKHFKIKYVKVFEPHKNDGVPHLHMLLFVPNIKEVIEDLKKGYCRYFSAPQNLKTDRINSFQKQNGELNGFQISINNSLAYVMKYLQKTFLDLKNNNLEDIKLDKLRVWYMKYKIRRFTSSRFSCPLWIYRKINAIVGLRDYYFLNKYFENKENCVTKDIKNKEFYFHFEETKQSVIYCDKELIYERKKFLINQIDTSCEVVKDTNDYRRAV